MLLYLIRFIGGLMILYNYLTEESWDTVAKLTIIFAYICAILFALSIHEFAHGFVAYKQGDLTAKAYGRLSLNPFKHIDVLGFIFLIIAGFGWSKPVPINPLSFKNGKKSAVLVCIAGVTTNFILAIIFSFFAVLTMLLDTSITFCLFLQYFCNFSLIINFVFFVFNLLPIYPLDGFNLLATLLRPGNKFLQFMFKFGIIILLFLLLFNIIDVIIGVLESIIISPLIELWCNILF
jgi:Zn-dependent protease